MDYLEEVLSMVTIPDEERELVDQAEFLAATLIRGAILQYMSR